MGKSRLWLGLLLLSLCFSSCTCERALPPVPKEQAPEFRERAKALRTESPSPAVAQATPTPKAEQLAVASPEPSPAELPQDFPPDVPIYAGAQLSQVHELPNNAHNVIFRAAGEVDDINRFYHEKLQAAGWNVVQQFARKNHAFMTYKKGNLVANITIAEDARDPSNKVIAIMYEEEQPLPFDEF
jgi:hypothetical protein